MDEKAKGAWLSHHTQKLSGFESSPRFEDIEVAGKAGKLLSSLSATGNKHPTKRKEVLRREQRAFQD
jgi:hypothetical protein